MDFLEFTYQAKFNRSKRDSEDAQMELDSLNKRYDDLKSQKFDFSGKSTLESKIRIKQKALIDFNEDLKQIQTEYHKTKDSI